MLLFCFLRPQTTCCTIELQIFALREKVSVWRESAEKVVKKEKDAEGVDIKGML